MPSPELKPHRVIPIPPPVAPVEERVKKPSTTIRVSETVYRTPDGLFRTLQGVSDKYGWHKPNTHRKYTKSKTARAEGFYMITPASDQQLEAAVANQEEYYLSVEVPKVMDDQLFLEDCWVDNRVGDTVYYSFKRKKFSVGVGDWTNGVRPHKEIR